MHAELPCFSPCLFFSLHPVIAAQRSNSFEAQGLCEIEFFQPQYTLITFVISPDTLLALIYVRFNGLAQFFSFPRKELHRNKSEKPSGN